MGIEKYSVFYFDKKSKKVLKKEIPESLKIKFIKENHNGDPFKITLKDIKNFIKENK